MSKSDRNKKIVELCNTHTHQEIAELFNISTKTVQRCLRKHENKPTPKTIELDPLLDARLNNIDYMILQREIELSILRKLKASK